MAPLDYVLLYIALLIAGYTGAAFAYRAIYRAYTRWKNERDTAAAVARYREQERKTLESFKTSKRR